MPSPFNQLNPWFNFYSYTPEQDFYADFIDEEIRLAGTEVLYIPREFTSVDDILGEPYQTLYSRFYPMAARITDINGYTGQPDVMSKFGIQFKPESEWIISKRMFRALQIPERELRPHERRLAPSGFSASHL